MTKSIVSLLVGIAVDLKKICGIEGSETTFFRKLNAYDLLIIDDFGMARLEGLLQHHDFEQIVDDR